MAEATHLQFPGGTVQGAPDEELSALDGFSAMPPVSGWFRPTDYSVVRNMIALWAIAPHPSLVLGGCEGALLPHDDFAIL